MVSGMNIIGQNKALQDHWIRRVIAYIIDSIIVTIVAAIISIFFFPFWGGFGGLFIGLGVALWAVFAILYWLIQEGWKSVV